MPWVQAMNLHQVELYLCSLLKQPVTIDGLVPLRRRPGETEVKGYGYGTPVRVDYRTAERERRSAVIHTMDSGPFGHVEYRLCRQWSHADVASAEGSLA